jgi:hypothetical protein
MIPFIGELIGNVVGIAGDYFKDKRALKAAKVEAELHVLKARATADIDWDKQAMINAESSWKDEWFVILLSIPAVMAFIPGLAPYVGLGFDELAKSPDWYLGAFGIAVAASFGFRKFANKMTSKV